VARIMANVVFLLCALMSLLCTILLFRGYLRSKSRLLLWSSLSFFFLAISNEVLFIDMVIIPYIDIDGPFWRNLMGSISGSLLLFGLIWEVT
jgi:hypothetical protein